MKFETHNPDQSYLIPPSVIDVLGKEHLVFFIRQTDARLDLLKGAQVQSLHHPAHKETEMLAAKMHSTVGGNKCS